MSRPAPVAEQDHDAAGPIARAIRSRRTIHDFRTAAPARSLVLAALDAARWAPNHHLSEPWHFYLLGPQTIAQIVELNAELTARKRGPEAAEEKRARWGKIPGWLVATCDRSEDSVRAQEDYAACCCVIQNFQLCLWEVGVGVKWTTGAVTREAAFYDAIWVDPEVENVVGLLWYGYPEEVPMTARKAVEEILVSLP